MSDKKKRGRPKGWRKYPEEKRPVGRPKAKLDLPEGWQDHILSMYSEGCSDVEIKAWISKQRGEYSEGLWQRWVEEEPDFSKTIKIGKEIAHAWWERRGRDGLMNIPHQPTLNTALWFINMKNRFGWKDKQEVTHDGSIKFEPHLISREPE